MESLEQIALVGAVLAVLGIALWILQRRGFVRLKGIGIRPRAERELELIERLQLTPHHSVCLVRLNDRNLLIGTAPNSCTLLDDGGPS